MLNYGKKKKNRSKGKNRREGKKSREPAKAGLAKAVKR
jgi:hypothetical protein